MSELTQQDYARLRSLGQFDTLEARYFALRARLEAGNAAGVKAELDWDVERNELKRKLEAVERERDRHQQDSLQQAATIKRMGEATEDRNEVDRKRQKLHQQQLAAAQGRIETLETERQHDAVEGKAQIDTLTTRLSQVEEALKLSKEFLHQFASGVDPENLVVNITIGDLDFAESVEQAIDQALTAPPREAHDE